MHQLLFSPRTLQQQSFFFSSLFNHSSVIHSLRCVFDLLKSEVAEVKPSMHVVWSIQCPSVQTDDLRI